MQFVPAGLNYATHMKAAIQQGSGLSLRTLVCLILTNKKLNLLGNKTANRGAMSGREDLDLPQRFPAEAHGHIVLGRILRCCHNPHCDTCGTYSCPWGR